MAVGERGRTPRGGEEEDAAASNDREEGGASWRRRRGRIRDDGSDTAIGLFLLSLPSSSSDSPSLTSLIHLSPSLFQLVIVFQKWDWF